MKEKKLFLLDAYALIYRAYYAFINNPMMNSSGLNTSTIFGFVNTLDEILRNQRPSHIGVVFDPPGKTFRNDLYPEYKAHRESTPEDIKAAIPWICKVLEAYNIPNISVTGFEADDVIGTLATKAAESGFTVYMMTPDKDFAQLVTENILIYKPGRSGSDAEILDVEKVNAKYGIESPHQVIDILALWGDVSDNIPGVPNVGEKTASKLIQEYKTVAGILNNITNLKGKLKDNVDNNKEQLLLSLDLVTIRTNVPVEFNPESLEYKAYNKDMLINLFKDLEFKTLTNRLLEKSMPKPNLPIQTSLFDMDSPTFEPSTIQSQRLETIHTIEHEYVIVNSPADIQGLVQKLLKVDEFAFDTETTGLDLYTSELVGMSFSFKYHKGYYVPIPADKVQALERLNFFIPVFTNKMLTIVGQNIKFDYQMLRAYDIELQGNLFDTLLAHYIIQPELRHNLTYLCEQYLAYMPVEIEELIGKKGKSQGNMRQVDLKEIAEYAVEDADVTFQLKAILEKELQSSGSSELAMNIEMPLIRVLAEMELAGVQLDSQALNLYSKVLENDLESIEKQIFGIAGKTFNIASPKQLGDILFDELKISNNPPKTKTKQYSTSEETLEKFANTHPIVQLILEYRSVNKLLSTYVSVLPKLVNPISGRLHTSFNQTIAATGRLSSNNPNLQNIPIREERGREIRKAFIARDENHILLAADYSQIELRLMAHMSNDANMIGAFLHGEDIHTATAANIYGVALENVTREMRSKAKTANFGIIYGISAFGLSQRLSIPRGEASELISNYFKSFPGVKEYMTNAILKARDNGFVETIMGRKRYLRDIHSNNAIVRGVAERNAINAPIQGSAADIIKMAMIKIFNAFSTNKLKSQMVLQVHDELVFDVYKPELERVKEIVKFEMENTHSLKVPLTIEMGSGENWLLAH